MVIGRKVVSPLADTWLQDLEEEPWSLVRFSEHLVEYMAKAELRRTSPRSFSYRAGKNGAGVLTRSWRQARGRPGRKPQTQPSLPSINLNTETVTSARYWATRLTQHQNADEGPLPPSPTAAWIGANQGPTPS